MADSGEMIEGLFHIKRAVDGGDSGSGSTGSTFTKHKCALVVSIYLYLTLIWRSIFDCRLRRPFGGGNFGCHA
jgi:hypothetical protein